MVYAWNDDIAMICNLKTSVNEISKWCLKLSIAGYCTVMLCKPGSNSASCSVLVCPLALCEMTVYWPLLAAKGQKPPLYSLNPWSLISNCMCFIPYYMLSSNCVVSSRQLFSTWLYCEELQDQFLLHIAYTIRSQTGRCTVHQWSSQAN